MKPILSLLITIGACSPATQAAPTNAPPAAVNPLVAKHDVNRNGKIDVNERKPYMHELSRQRREEAKTFAAQQPILTPQEREFYHLPRMTPELIQQYDTNHDGKLDTTERLKILEAAAEVARQEFRRFDINQDGKLDKEEFKAMQKAKQAEREHSSTARSTTNSPPSTITRPPMK